MADQRASPLIDVLWTPADPVRGDIELCRILECDRFGRSDTGIRPFGLTNVDRVNAARYRPSGLVRKLTRFGQRDRPNCAESHQPATAGNLITEYPASRPGSADLHVQAAAVGVQPDPRQRLELKSVQTGRLRHRVTTC